jgi:hypothetical protein
VKLACGLSVGGHARIARRLVALRPGKRKCLEGGGGGVARVRIARAGVEPLRARVDKEAPGPTGWAGGRGPTRRGRPA